jgi:hypothetical protein
MTIRDAGHRIEAYLIHVVVDVLTYDNQLLCQARKIFIQSHSQSMIRQYTGSINADPIRILLRLVDHELSSSHSRGRGRIWESFNEGTFDNTIWITPRSGVRLKGFSGRVVWREDTLPWQNTMDRLPCLETLDSVDERPC